MKPEPNCTAGSPVDNSRTHMMLPAPPTPKKRYGASLFLLLISLVVFYYQGVKSNQALFRRWDARQQRRQEEEERVAREAWQTRQAIQKMVQENLKSKARKPR